MELNTRTLLIISISSLLLSFSGEARSLAPSEAPVSYISSTPKASPASSPSQLPSVTSSDTGFAFALETYVISGSLDAEKALDILGKRAGDHSISSAEAECLEQCVENYGDVVDNFKKARGDISAADHYLVSEDLSAVSADLDACLECYEEMVGTAFPMLDVEYAIRTSASKALDVLQYTS